MAGALPEEWTTEETDDGYEGTLEGTMNQQTTGAPPTGTLRHNVSMVCGTKEKAHSSFNALKWFYHVWGMSWASNGTPGTPPTCRELFFLL